MVISTVFNCNNLSDCLSFNLVLGHNAVSFFYTGQYVTKKYCLHVQSCGNIYFFYFEVDEANSQREISSSHSHLWPTTITKYAAGFSLKVTCFLYKQNVEQQKGIWASLLKNLKQNRSPLLMCLKSNSCVVLANNIHGKVTLRHFSIDLC